MLRRSSLTLTPVRDFYCHSLSFPLPFPHMPSGRMVKLADTPALGAGAARREGSSPSPPTTKKLTEG